MSSKSGKKRMSSKGIKGWTAALLISFGLILAYPGVTLALSQQPQEPAANQGTQTEQAKDRTGQDGQNAGKESRQSDQDAKDQAQGQKQSKGKSQQDGNASGKDAKAAAAAEADRTDAATDQTDAPADAAADNPDAAAEADPADAAAPLNLKQQVISFRGEDYTVTVKGNLPEGAVLDVTEIGEKDADYDAYAADAAALVLSENKIEGDSLPYLRLFDIHILYGQDQPFQPDESVIVRINLDDDVLKTKDVDFDVVHFAGSDQEAGEKAEEEAAGPELLPAKIKEEKAEAAKDDTQKTDTQRADTDEKQAGSAAQPCIVTKTDHFSVFGLAYHYTVDFYYNPAAAETGDKTDGGNDKTGDSADSKTGDSDKSGSGDSKTAAESREYHMNGGSQMLLSHLFDKLGIDRNTEDIDEVTFTDDSLLTFAKAGSDYEITSLKPFTTSEALTIAFKDGEKLLIGVEDEIGSGTIGTDIQWSIDDSGKLVIEPAAGKTTGTLPNVENIGGNPPNPDRIEGNWPWYAHRDSITSLEIKPGVKTNKNARGMFHGLTSLETADLSGLDASNLHFVHDMFSSCTSLQSITFPGNFGPRQGWRMCKGCSSLTEITFGSETDPFGENLSKKDGNIPFHDLDGSGGANAAFYGCSSLTTINMPGARLYYWEQIKELPKLMNSISNANSSLKTFNLEKAQIDGGGPAGNPVSPARTIFKFDTLGTLNLSGATIYENNLRLLFHNANNGESIVDYNACAKLQKVDMTDVTFQPYYNPDTGNGRVSAFQMFRGLKGLTEVNLSGAQFPDGTGEYEAATNFSQMFRDCTVLEKAVLADTTEQKLNVKGAENMSEMFSGCSSLKHLDLSGFGKLDNIQNMNEVVNSTCTALEYLNINNLDNSAIRIRRGSEHPGKDDGRMFFGYNPPALTSLKTIEAKNSKVWFVKNNSAGLPSDPLYAAAFDSDIFYLTNKVTEFKSDADLTETIDSKRDWIDLIKDHYGKSSGASSIPDAATNINFKDGHLNTNGAGFLAPGVYTIGDKDWKEPTIKLEQTFYRISNIESSKPTITITDSQDRLDLDEDKGTVMTRTYSRAQWLGGTVGQVTGKDCTLSNDDGSPLITLTYPEAAQDIYGQNHDVILTINAITYKNLDRIKESEGVRHDPNNYIGAGGSYKRDVLLSKQGILNFRNYVIDKNGKHAISGGSGTYIDFDITVKDALPGTSVLFYMEDLDVPAYQNHKPGIDPADKQRDWCYGELPDKVDNDGYGNTWGPGSEGMILGNGNDLETLKFADHTGLEVVGGNQIISTGGDPNTAWSSFSVRAAATGSSYTWTSGVACDTYLLRQTEAPEGNQNVYVMPEALKLVSGSVPSGTYANRYFNFSFKKADASVQGVSYENYAGERISVTGLSNMATNQALKGNVRGVVEFDTLKLAKPASSDEKNLYLYEISEQQGTTEGDILRYDDTKFYMQVVVSGPQTDLELYKGTRADVILGTKSGNGPIRWDRSNVITIWASDAQPALDADNNPILGPKGAEVFIDANGTSFYRDKDTGVLSPYNSSSKLIPATRAQVSRKVYFSKDDEEKTVRVDHNGVEYIKGNDGNYYDPDNENQLFTPKTGDIDPARTAKDRVVAVKKTVTDGGSSYDVQEDIHGVQYYVKDGKYYDPASPGDELTVKDGTFNPDTNEDKVVYVNKTHTYQGHAYDVYEHFNGKEYFKVGNGYYNPADDSPWELKSDGDVDPHDTDEIATTDKTEYKERKETVTGRNYTIRKDKNGVLYFRNATTTKKTADGDEIRRDSNGVEYYENGGKYYAPDGTELTEQAGVFEPADTDSTVQVGDDKYYTPYNTLLTVKTGEFEPDSSDKPAYHTYEIWVDSEGNEFYKNEKKYYDMTGKEVKLGEGTLDTSEIVTVGTFENELKTSEIVIRKETESGKGRTGGQYTFQVTFSNNFNPVKAGWQYSPASLCVPKQISKDPNTWEFILEEDQQILLQKVPFQTKYSVVEIPERGHELSEIKTGSSSVNEVKDITITKEPQDAGNDYTHTFTNRITQLIVDKRITNVPAGTDVSDSEFSFTAEVTKSGMSEGEEFSFGWLQEDNSSEFKTAKYKDGKLTGNTITFRLKDGEDIALVVPQGADVKVTEDTQTYIASTSRDDGQAADGYDITAENVTNPSGTGALTTLHFNNKYVLPVSYDKIVAEKVISNHSFMPGYEFEMGIFPIKKDFPANEDYPMPEKVKKNGDAVYAPVYIGSNSTETADGYKENFDSITYTNEDMKSYNETDKVWEQVEQKTFSYIVRELPPQGGGEDPDHDAKRAPGLTYSSERYQVDVTVKLNREGAKLELIVDSTATYKLIKDENGDWIKETDASGKPKVYEMATFTNSYDPNKSAYRMIADKVLTSTDAAKTLRDGDFYFIMKPYGDNASKAPMPKDKVREEGGQTKVYDVGTEYENEQARTGPYFRAKNLNHMVRFLNNTDPEDGLWFDKDELIDDFGEDALKAEAGVIFDYEMYEELPEEAVNNNDSTWSVTDDEGNTTLYDGIHHIRSLKLRLIENEDYQAKYDPSSAQYVPQQDPNSDQFVRPGDMTDEQFEEAKAAARDASVQWILSLDSVKNDSEGDFFINKKGEKQLVNTLPHHVPADHHTKGGSPIFRNFYFKQEKGDIEIIKEWNDRNDMDEIRPDSIKVRISSDEKEPLNKTVTLHRDSSGHWRTTVTGLPVYSDVYDRTSAGMAKIKYTVAEVEDGVITGDAEGYTPTYDRKMPFELNAPEEKDQPADPITVTITNSHTPIPGKAGPDETYGLKNQPQRGTPEYDLTPTNPMEAKHLVVPKDGLDTYKNQEWYKDEYEELYKSSYADEDGWVVIPKVGKYLLNRDNDRSITFMPEKDYTGDPPPILVYCVDKLETSAVAAYTPHVVEDTEKETGSRTIHFTYLTKDGDEVIDPVKQSATITRHATAIDSKTGKITAWTDWSTDTLPAVANPDDVAGPDWYTTDEVRSVDISDPEDLKKLEDVYVIYHRVPTYCSVTVSKVWEDQKDKDGIRPDSVTVHLLANGDQTDYDPLILSEDNQWQDVFRDLPEKIDGETIEYTVEEDAVEDYETDIKAKTDDPHFFVITNTHEPEPEPETVTITGQKTWEDEDDNDGKRPESITIHLQANGEDAPDVAPKTVTADDDWAWTFENLPKQENGEDIVYTVREVHVDGYTASYTYKDGHHDVTNTYTPGKTKVEVSKHWEDDGDKAGKRPDTVTVRLFADGQEADVDPIQLSAENRWRGTFTDLPAMKSGKEISYTVKEDAVEGYETDIKAETDDPHSFVITNTYEPEPEPETVTITGQKTWEDEDDNDGKRPESITIHLQANGEDAPDVAPKTVTADDDWAWTFENLPKQEDGKDIVYTVREVHVDGYTASYAYKDGHHDVTNTYTPGKTKVEVSKHWEDDGDKAGKRPDTVTVRLFADGQEADVDPIQLSAENRWRGTFTDLPAMKSGKEISYTVKEDAVEDYETSVRVEPDDPHAFEIINRYTEEPKPETVTVKGKKTWNDEDDRDGKRPESITIRLLADGEIAADVAPKTVTARDDWAWTFEDLPKYSDGAEIKYSIAEEAVADYDARHDGMNVTNTYTPGRTSVRVSKSWRDKDDADEIRPAFVTIHLLADGKETGESLTLSDDNDWTDSFTDLPVKKAGEDITYTVKEEKVKGYTTVISGDQKTGYTVINTHKPKPGSDDPDKPDKPNGKSKGSRTGDDVNLFLGVAALLASALALTGILAARRRYRR